MPLKNIINKFSKSGTKSVSVCLIDTPVGKIYGAADDDFLYTVTFEDSKNFEKCFQLLCENLSCGLVDDKNSILKELEKQLGEYFAGNLKKFKLPIKTFGTEFQQVVWDKLQDIPYSSTHTYGELAKALGRSASHARAVGSACGANTHLIIIPCHRLVGSASKGGFSSGIDRKQWLLDHEKKYASN